MAIKTQKSNQCLADNQITRLEVFLDSKITTLIISGKKAAGKSVLLEKIIHFFSSSHEILHLHATDNLKPQQLLQKLYHFTSSEAPNLRLRFEDQIQSLIPHIRQQKKILLAIDNAQELTYSVLAAISHLSLVQEKQTPSVQIVLTGHPELCEKMQSIQTRPVSKINLSLDNPAILSQVSLLLAQHKTTWLNKLSMHISSLTNASTSNQTLPSDNSGHSNASQVTVFWVHHQVKLISLSGILMLSFGMWYFNRIQQSHQLIPQLAYNSTTSSIPIATNRLTLLATNHRPSFYGIQLISSPNKKDTQRYISTHHLTNVATIHNQHHQYQATIGHYNTYKEAQKALHSMPSDSKKYHPWIKKITA